MGVSIKPKPSVPNAITGEAAAPASIEESAPKKAKRLENKAAKKEAMQQLKSAPPASSEKGKPRVPRQSAADAAL